MAEAIIGGLLATGYPMSRILVAEPLTKRQEVLSRKFGITLTHDNDAAVRSADVVLLAVKPQVMKVVAESISDAVLASRPVIITIAAGIRICDLERWLTVSAAASGASKNTHNPDGEGEESDSPSSSTPSSGLSIIRAMPNTPALVLHGATGLYANESVTVKEKSAAFEILSSVSQEARWVDSEDLLDVVTALSGKLSMCFSCL
jgi:pyrroline-5-carboxylate reductase